MQNNIAKKILLGVALLTTAIPLLYVKYSLYPISYPKTVAYQVLVILALLVIAYVWMKFPKSRPRKNALIIGLLLFFIVQVVAAFAGVDVQLSFFGQMVRSTGLFFQLHVLAFILIFSSGVFGKKDWRLLFSASLLISIVVAVLGIVQYFLPSLYPNFSADRISSSLGNPLFLGTYLMVNMFFVPLVWHWNSSKLIRGGLIVGTCILLIAFMLAVPRGPMLGLFFGGTVFLLLLSKNWKKLWRRLFFVLVVVGVLMGALLIVFRNTDFVQSTPFSRISGTTSLSSRAINWSMAWEGIKAKPVLGWGSQNYRYVVDEHFDNALTELSYIETFSDKPHNAFLEVVVDNGFVGGVLYLFIGVMLIVVLVKANKKELISRTEFSVWIGLGVAYLVQDFFLFETGTSFILAGYCVAYVLWLSFKLLNKKTNCSEGFVLKGFPRNLIMVVVILFSGFLIMRYNYLPLKSSITTNTGLQYTYINDWVRARPLLLEAFDIYTPYDFARWRWAAESAASMVYEDTPNQSEFDLPEPMRVLWRADIEKFAEYGEELVAQNTNYINTSFLGKYYYQLAVATKDIEKVNRAHELFVLATEISPRREEAWFLIAQSFIFQSRFEEAKQVIYKINEWSPNSEMTAWHLAFINLKIGNTEEGLIFIRKAIDLGFNIENDSQREIIAQAYVKVDNLDGLVWFYEYITTSGNVIPDWHTRLAAAYAAVGRVEDAKEVARRVIRDYPEMANDAQVFINSLEQLEQK